MITSWTQQRAVEAAGGKNKINQLKFRSGDRIIHGWMNDGWIMDDGALIIVDVFVHMHKKEKTSPIKVRQCKRIKDVFSVAADNGVKIGAH